jgi:glycosyltransferase involved in cell wall biosynthesis
VRRLAVWFEGIIYKNARHIVGLSPGMVNGVTKFENLDKVSMIPNMAKIDEFWPRAKNLILLESLGLKASSFKLIHFGSLGIANDGMSILRAAELLSSDKSIEFVFIGGGSTEEELKRYCLKRGMKNVFFLGRYSMKETSEIVNFCDASMVSFKDIPILYTNSPNKLFDSMSAGKPIILNSAGWTKDLVYDANCGYYVNPKRPEELVKTIRKLQNNPELCSLLGKNARNLAEKKYDKDILCDQYLNLLETLV